MYSLDDLPPELKTTILRFLPDVKTLRLMVKASPDYHGAYRSQRKVVLFDVLCNELPPTVIIDATNLVGVWRAKLETSSGLDVVRDSIQQYQADRKSATPNSSILGSFTLQELSKICNFQYRLSNVANDFVHRTLASVPNTGKRFIYPPMRMTSNERRRTFRAFYRFEIFMLLFDSWNVMDEFYLDQYRLSEDFTASFEPWEIDEMHCVRTYMYGAYTQIFIEDVKTIQNLFLSQSQHEISPSHNRFVQESILKVLTPPEVMPMQSLSEESLYELPVTSIPLPFQLLRKGLLPLSKLIMEDDRGKRGSRLFQLIMMSAYSTLPRLSTLERTQWASETLKRLLEMSLADDNDSTCPNSAWLDFEHSAQIAHGPAGQFSGGVIRTPTQQDKRWAYAMWDGIRLRKLGMGGFKAVS
jgi:hypothetical protein